MFNFRVRLFGKFSIECKDQRIVRLQGRKVQELLSYLLLFQNQPQSREMLCELLWGNQPQDRSKKQLRQTLWRLQSILKEVRCTREPEILVDEDWIQFNPSSDFWLDISEFKKVFSYVNGKPAGDLIPSDFKAIQSAIELHQGNLLEGWYQDWCLYERERYQVMHLILLDKLVEYCEIYEHYDTGLFYGTEILRQDHASERAHRQMMRLYFMSGDRTRALHQYKRCEAALREELEVEPSALTRQLHEQIRLDTFSPSSPSVFRARNRLPETVEPSPPLSAMLDRLEHLSNELIEIKARIKREITTLASPSSSPK